MWGRQQAIWWRKISGTRPAWNARKKRNEPNLAGLADRDRCERPDDDPFAPRFDLAGMVRLRIPSSTGGLLPADPAFWTAAGVRCSRECAGRGARQHSRLLPGGWN